MKYFKLLPNLFLLIAVPLLYFSPKVVFAGTCPCTCRIETATGPREVSIGEGITGVGTPSGPATLDETRRVCQESCQTQSTNNSGTSFTSTLGECPSSLFGTSATPSTGAASPTSTGDAASSGDETRIPLYNPLGAELGVAEIISRGIRTVIGIIGAMALLMFVYGGVMWMTAGESRRIDTAKQILKNSTIGLLLIFFSYSLVSIVFSVLGGA